MKIVFIYPKWTQEYKGISSYFARKALFPPLNIALLVAIARKNGHTAFCIDAEGENIGHNEIIERLRGINPDYVACTAMSSFFHISVDLCTKIKKEIPGIITIIGGQHITIMKEKAFDKCFDYAFIGECEKSLVSFLNGDESSKIKGLIYRNFFGGVVNTGPAEYIEDLNDLPFPAIGDLPYKKYKIGTENHGRLNFTAIQTIRGCPWKCIFCHSEELQSNRIRKRDPDLVVNELEHIVYTLGIRHFVFLDDVLTLDRKHIETICGEIIHRKLKITFEGSTRANLLDESIVFLMKKAGLIRLSFGLEAVDPTVREIIGKKVPLKAYSEANDLLGHYRIECVNSIMIGLPGETPETIRATFDFLKNDQNVKQANVAIATPYPGTEFYEMAKRGDYGMKLLTNDFSKYRRYGAAVTNVNGMSEQDLLDLQNEGFVRVYSAPWRWKAMIQKNGIIGGLLMLLRVLKLIFREQRNLYASR